MVQCCVSSKASAMPLVADGSHLIAEDGKRCSTTCFSLQGSRRKTIYGKTPIKGPRNQVLASCPFGVFGFLLNDLVAE